MIGALSTTDSDWFSFSSTDSSQLCKVRGAGLDAPGRQVRTRTFKSWNESDIKKIKIKIKGLQSDNSPTSQSRGRISTKIKNKIKQNIYSNHNIKIFFFISYIQLNSNINSLRSIYFYIIFKVPLIFSKYLHLYKPSTQFKVHILNTVSTSLHLQGLLFSPK